MGPTTPACLRRARVRARSSCWRTTAPPGAIGCLTSPEAGATDSRARDCQGQDGRLEPGDQSPEPASERHAGDASPRRPDLPPQPGHLALAAQQEPSDRRALELRELAGVLDEERPR